MAKKKSKVVETSPEYYYGTLTKLGNVDHPESPSHAMHPSQFITGRLSELPTIGSKCIVYDREGDSYLITSQIKSIYICEDENWDKLVLPSQFPWPEKLKIPRLATNDILFATCNSVYWFKPVLPLEKGV